MSASDPVADFLELLHPGVPPDQVGQGQVALAAAREGADIAVLNADIARLAEAVAQSERGIVARGVAAITAGAFVELGGDTRVLGEVLIAHLPEVLGPAGRFVKACQKALPDDYEPGEDTQMLSVGDEMVPLELVRQVGAGDFEGGVAWQALDYWALPCIACLTRDQGLRDLARRTPQVRNLAFEAVGYRGFLTTALDLLDDEVLLVLHPSTQQGYEVRISGVATNFDLQVLLADALVKDETSGPDGGIAGRRPTAAVVRATRGEATEPAPCEGHWNVYDGRALASGSLPDPVPSELWIWNEGRPSDIPEVEGRRVVVLAAPSYSRTWTAQPIFNGLAPQLSLDRTLSEAEVRGWLGRLTRN